MQLTNNAIPSLLDAAIPRVAHFIHCTASLMRPSNQARTHTCWKRRSSPGSFSIVFLNLSTLLAPAMPVQCLRGHWKACWSGSTLTLILTNPVAVSIVPLGRKKSLAFLPLTVSLLFLLPPQVSSAR
jgi:hypothetical protein